MTIGFAWVFTGVFVKYGKPNDDELGVPVGVGVMLVLGEAAAAVAPDELDEGARLIDCGYCYRRRSGRAQRPPPRTL